MAIAERSLAIKFACSRLKTMLEIIQRLLPVEDDCTGSQVTQATQFIDVRPKGFRVGKKFYPGILDKVPIDNLDPDGEQRGGVGQQAFERYQPGGITVVSRKIFDESVFQEIAGNNPIGITMPLVASWLQSITPP